MSLEYNSTCLMESQQIHQQAGKFFGYEHFAYPLMYLDKGMPYPQNCETKLYPICYHFHIAF